MTDPNFTSGQVSGVGLQQKHIIHLRVEYVRKYKHLERETSMKANRDFLRCDHMEWRYHSASHKMIAIEAGHACQNLYLACGAVGAGACAIGAFDRLAMDAVLGLNGEDEFSLYAAQLGKYLHSNSLFLKKW